MNFFYLLSYATLTFVFSTLSVKTYADNKTPLTSTNHSSLKYKTGLKNSLANGVACQKSIYFKGFNYDRLPVKYTNFNASIYDKGIQLQWVTEFERNNDYFEVQRSFDGTSFSTIGMVLDAETAVDKYKNYGFKDNASILAQKKVIYYRLKQVDKDGSFIYSTVVTFRLKAKDGVKIQSTPNPFTQKVRLSFTASANEQAIVKFINANGQVVLSQQNQTTEGYNNLTIANVSNLPSGTYIAQLIVNNQVIDSQKIIKQ
jgi:large repetitive protein